MQRPHLEHIIRAAAAITGADEFIVIGSQAVLGQFPNPPEELLVSIEADLFTDRGPQDSDLIDGTIGEGSPFHQTFGYYTWRRRRNRSSAGGLAGTTYSHSQ